MPLPSLPARIRRGVAVACATTLVVGAAPVALGLAAGTAQAQTRTGAVQSGASYAAARGYKVGIAVIDTRTGNFYGSGSYNSIFASESLIKVFIAARLILQGRMHGSTATRAYKMITQSDDAIASAFYGSVGGDGLINWVKAHYHVPDLGSPPAWPGWWGSTHLRPSGLAKLYVKLRADKKVAPWLLNAMHHATHYGSDGFYQWFGVPAASPHAAVKQGWGNDWDGGSNASQNSTGFVGDNRYVVIILGRGPASSYGSRIGSLLTQVAERVLPGGTFPDDRPTVTKLSSTSGPTRGGNRITVAGTNFRSVQRVLFGKVPGTAVKVLSTTRLQVTAPRHLRDWVNVRVITKAGYSRWVTPDRYLFEGPPVVSGLGTKSGLTAGGTRVVIKGANFHAVTSVKFGTLYAKFSVQSYGQLTAIAPRHGAARVDVRVTTRYGSSPIVTADRFVYGTAPAVTSVAPAQGSADGGTSVVIKGSAFTGATKVLFGSVAGTFTVQSDGQVTAVAPKHAAGPVDVRVVTGFGTSPLTAADRFTYVAGPTVAAVAPASGSSQQVTVTGTGFTSGSTVSIDGTEVTPTSVSSDGTSLTVVLPSHAPGPAHLSIVTPWGTSPAVTYTYQ